MRCWYSGVRVKWPEPWSTFGSDSYKVNAHFPIYVVGLTSPCQGHLWPASPWPGYGNRIRQEIVTAGKVESHQWECYTCHRNSTALILDRRLFGKKYVGISVGGNVHPMLAEGDEI